MKHIRNHRRVIGGITMYAKEYATVWEVTTKVSGLSDNNQTGRRYKKSEFKSVEKLALHIANSVRAIYEYTNRIGVQRVCATLSEYLFLKLNYDVNGLSEQEYKIYKSLN